MSSHVHPAHRRAQRAAAHLPRRLAPLDRAAELRAAATPCGSCLATAVSTVKIPAQHQLDGLGFNFSSYHVTLLADAATRLALEARLRDEGDKIWAGDYVDERTGHRAAALQASHTCGFVFRCRWCIAPGHPIAESTNFNINCRGACFAEMDLDLERGEAVRPCGCRAGICSGALCLKEGTARALGYQGL